MANNRVYLRCKNCGKVFLLGKCFLDGYYIANRNPQSFYDNLNNFYNKHNYCCDEFKDYGYEPKGKVFVGNNENIFEICYENYEE